MDNITNTLFFKNRLAKLRRILKEGSIDCILIILGMSSLNNISQHKLANWLIFNYSSLSNLEEKSIPINYLDTFIVIRKNRIFFFSEEENKKELYELTFGCGVDCNFYFATKAEMEDIDHFQNIKIAKFIQELQDLTNIGVALTLNESGNKLEFEKWPLINAYGLDILKQGFFTLNKNIIDISSNLDNHKSYLTKNTELIYYSHDISSIFNLIPLKVRKQETLVHDMIILIEKEQPNLRQYKSEIFYNSNSELELLIHNYSKLKDNRYLYLSNLPDSSIKVGLNSNMNNESNGNQSLYKIEHDINTPPMHYIYENFDPTTGIRIGRTYFLTNLQKLYPYFNDINEIEYSENKTYKDIFLFFQIYIKSISILRAYEVRLVEDEVINISKFLSELVYELNMIYKTQKNYRDTFEFLISHKNITLDINYYSLLSQSSSKNNCVANIRLQIKNITSLESSRIFGSLLYSDSYLVTLSNKVYNLTRDILPIKFNYSTDLHVYNEEIGNNTFNHSTKEYTFYKTLKFNNNLLFESVSYKGLSFVFDKFTLEYLFPSSKDLGYDYNQLFVPYYGNLLVMNNMLLFNDTALGWFLIQEKDINNIFYSEDSKSLFLLLNLNTMETIPYSGLIKNEILLFFNKDYLTKHIISDLVKFLKEGFLKKKLFYLSKDKKYEYDLCLKAYNDTYNQQESNNSSQNISIAFNSDNFVISNLHQVTNDYNLTSIYDEISLELPDLEYLINLNIEKSYDTYMESISEFNIMSNILLNKKTCFDKQNAILLVSSSSNKLHSFSLLLRDYFCLKGLSCEINNLTNQKTKVVILTKHCIKPGKEVYESINKLISNKYNLTSVCYVLNDSKIVSDTNGDLSEEINSLSDLYLYNCIFYDAEILLNENTHYKSVVSLITKMTKAYNTLTILNKSDELLNLVKSNHKTYEEEDSNFIFNYAENVRNNKYFKYFSQANDMSNDYEELTINQTFKFNKDIFMLWIRELVNKPLLSWENKINKENKQEQSSPTTNNSTSILAENNINDLFSKKSYLKNRFKYHTDYLLSNLKEITSQLLLKNKEPFYYCCEGTIKFLNNDIIKFYVNSTESYYEYMKAPVQEEVCKITFYGMRLINNERDINQMLLKFTGEFPKKQKYKTEDDISQEERNNLNLINFEKPIPEGWFTDGPYFVDPSGKRFSDHPSIKSIIADYLKITNDSIQEYNISVEKEIKNLHV